MLNVCVSVSHLYAKKIEIGQRKREVVYMCACVCSRACLNGTSVNTYIPESNCIQLKVFVDLKCKIEKTSPSSTPNKKRGKINVSKKTNLDIKRKKKT